MTVNTLDKRTITFNNYLKLDASELLEFERLQQETFPEGKQVVNMIQEQGRSLGM